MIPQPFEELEERANDVQIIAITIALLGIAIAGVISWYIAGILSHPIQSVVDASILKSDENQNPMVSEVSTSYRFIPHELRELLNSFNLMRNKINTMTSALHSKIDHANEEVKTQNIKLKNSSEQLIKANEKLGTEVEERRKAQEESALQSSRLRSLYNSTQLHDLTHDEKILNVLTLGCEFFDMEIGRVCEIDQENNTNTIRYVVAPENNDLKPGKITDLDKTFCKIPYTKEEVVSISNVAMSEWKNTACSQYSSLEAYLATVIWVEGKKYGTINFSSLKPRNKSFSDSDIDFMKIMAQWVGISMERRISEYRDHAKNAAEAANQAKGIFLANMSHELRTPINAILGYGEILIEDCDEFGNAQMKEDLEKIRIAGKHLNKLISNILDLSKIEAGKVDLQFNNFDIVSITTEVLDTARPLVGNNQNQISVQIDDDVASMYSDPTLIKQILLNLISNAAKFTKNGQIRLEATNAILNGDAAIRFTVSDSGIGMTNEQIEVIFNEFSQANTLTPSEHGGIGLGLSIARKYCGFLNGEISATSTVGKGSEFYVTLPCDSSTSTKTILSITA